MANSEIEFQIGDMIVQKRQTGYSWRRIAKDTWKTYYYEEVSDAGRTVDDGTVRRGALCENSVWDYIPAARVAFFKRILNKWVSV
jgi:hypothetical protein